jgi:glucose-6-phosphate isomerase
MFSNVGLGYGRFSLWSAVGLTISLAIGFDNFDELLVVQMKWMIILKRLILIRICRLFLLISIWYNNFFGLRAKR